MSFYNQRGVSAQKEDVHKATGKLSKGLYPYAFCKVFADYLGGDDSRVNIMHADGAGTKSILAYLYWKETGDSSVWKGIAQDAIAMNLDDLLCVGVYDNLLFSSTIDRNKQNIPGEILEQIINGTQEFFDRMEAHHIHIRYLGGETADVGDIVRTIAVNGTMTARWPKTKLITNERIQAGDVIIGLASYGMSTYEEHYNSGIGSNGLTSARHDLLHKAYSERFNESYDPALAGQVVYTGPYGLTDVVDNPGQLPANIGQLLLSPTRTYAPVLRALLEEQFDGIHGLIHCSGGGQTKCLKYLPDNFKIIKDNLFAPPVIFQLIQQASGADNREMYQVFNMGHRLEIFTTEAAVSAIIAVANRFNIAAQVVGRVEISDHKSLELTISTEKIIYGD